ncbi:hypothetical protein HDU76_001420 [Blyttiomyces sp. JEL0837]|nr:hypothetical protein HDU76_001420 [Blyttiomyces sp. JEL0837]
MPGSTLRSPPLPVLEERSGLYLPVAHITPTPVCNSTWFETFELVNKPKDIFSPVTTHDVSELSTLYRWPPIESLLTIYPVYHDEMTRSSSSARFTGYRRKTNPEIQSYPIQSQDHNSKATEANKVVNVDREFCSEGVNTVKRRATTPAQVNTATSFTYYSKQPIALKLSQQTMNNISQQQLGQPLTPKRMSYSDQRQSNTMITTESPSKVHLWIRDDEYKTVVSNVIRKNDTVKRIDRSIPSKSKLSKKVNFFVRMKSNTTIWWNQQFMPTAHLNVVYGIS